MDEALSVRQRAYADGAIVMIQLQGDLKVLNCNSFTLVRSIANLLLKQYDLFMGPYELPHPTAYIILYVMSFGLIDLLRLYCPYTKQSPKKGSAGNLMFFFVINLAQR